MNDSAESLNNIKATKNITIESDDDDNDDVDLENFFKQQRYTNDIGEIIT